MNNFCSRVTSRLNSLPRLRSWGELLLFVQIVCFASTVPLLMRLRLTTVQSLLAPRKVPLSPSHARVQQIVNYVTSAVRLGRPVIRDSCLIRGLTLYYFLNRAGLNIALYFGMGKLADEFAAHCWLVRDGEPFLECQDPRPLFSTVYCFHAERDAQT